MRTLFCFETSGSVYPLTQRHISLRIHNSPIIWELFAFTFLCLRTSHWHDGSTVTAYTALHYVCAHIRQQRVHQWHSHMLSAGLVNSSLSFLACFFPSHEDKLWVRILQKTALTMVHPGNHRKSLRKTTKPHARYVRQSSWHSTVTLPR
jgi:hypothetical protein